MISKDRYEFIVSSINGMALDALWLYTEDDGSTFDDRKTVFLELFKRMLDDRIIVAGKKGVMAKSSDDAVMLLNERFPLGESELDGGVWFFTDACPLGIGWRREDDVIDWV
ncbi:DUF596 domain-containing protein [Paraburkholderia bannensis]|nr:DUF596 domain-containing protein [Paraburkholderia bannensis]